MTALPRIVAPANESLQDTNGNLTQAWLRHFQAVADRPIPDTAALTAATAAAQSTATSAQAAATTADAHATAAAAVAADAEARLDALLASPPIWVVGDYRQTAVATLGSNWLLCDGSSFSTSTYPALESVLSSITAVGGTSGTRKLPSIPVVYDPAHPSGPAILRTFIRAS